LPWNMIPFQLGSEADIIIPFYDLRAQHEEVRAEMEAVFHQILDSSCFVGGPYVTDFETNFAKYCEAGNAVAVSTGTDALRLALMAVGVRPGDEVITVPNTFIATVEAITLAGAHPVFVDIDPETRLMDPLLVRRFLDEKCKRNRDGKIVDNRNGRPVACLLPVHLYGLPVDMAGLLKLAREYSLRVVEDACQAHGARCRVDGQWKRVGALGDAAAFSFYPGKNLGALGEGGAVTTNDPEAAAKVRLLRDHGQKERYIHITPDGWNARLDSIQCAVLNIKLQRLDDWNSRRRKIAAYYRRVLADLTVQLPAEPDYAEPVYHLFVIEHAARDVLRRELRRRGIETGLHYPIPLHLQQAYSHLGLRQGSFPRAEKSAASLLSLPMHPSLSESQADAVANACHEILHDPSLERERTSLLKT
jgi:dTDP-4-amino-4,6-dideoxygalactose transaminase